MCVFISVFEKTLKFIVFKKREFSAISKTWLISLYTQSQRIKNGKESLINFFIQKIRVLINRTLKHMDSYLSKKKVWFFFFWVKKVLIFGSIKEIVFGLEFGFEVKKKKDFDFRDFILE